LSSAAKNKSLKIIRKALRVQAPLQLPKEEKIAKAIQNMGIQHGICKCGGKMHIIKTIINSFRIKPRVPLDIRNQISVNSCIKVS